MTNKARYESSKLSKAIEIQPIDLCESIDGYTVEVYGYMFDGFDLFITKYHLVDVFLLNIKRIQYRDIFY